MTPADETTDDYTGKLYRGEVCWFEVQAENADAAAAKMIAELRDTGGTVYVVEDHESLDDLLHGYAFEGTKGVPCAVKASDLVSELMEAVRVLDQVVNAHRDPEPVGDYDPVRAAVSRADLLRERFAEVIAKAQEVSK